MKKIRFGKKSYIVMTEEELEKIEDRGRWLYASARGDLDMFEEFVHWHRNDETYVANTKTLIPKWMDQIKEAYRRFLDSMDC